VGGLNDKKQCILKEAAEILSILATRFDSAGKERKNVLDARGAMEVKVRAALQGSFATLTSVPDHVAFVATTSESDQEFAHIGRFEGCHQGKRRLRQA
jgi:hypothetical protein